MKRLDGVNLRLKDQNVDMGAARKSHDYDDCDRFFQWLEVQNPFNIEDAHLHFVSTGIFSVASKDPVDCENPETIGVRIQESLDKHPFNEAKIKRKEKLITLDYFTRNGQVDKSPMVVNPIFLFTRLTAIAGRKDDVEKYFSFELTHGPLALIEDKLMRKPDKASLISPRPIFFKGRDWIFELNEIWRKLTFFKTRG